MNREILGLDNVTKAFKNRNLPIDDVQISWLLQGSPQYEVFLHGSNDEMELMLAEKRCSEDLRRRFRHRRRGRGCAGTFPLQRRRDGGAADGSMMSRTRKVIDGTWQQVLEDVEASNTTDRGG